jgi:hypothetical protein
MIHRALVIKIGLLLVVVLAACGSSVEPTAVVTATPMVAPTPLPQIVIITADPETDFDGFVSQIPTADYECLTDAMGEGRLKELAGGDEPDESEQFELSNCFSNELVAGLIAGQIQRSLGEISGSSLACVASVLDDIPNGALSELMIGTGEPQSEGTQLALQGFLECLTQAELGAFASLDDVGDSDSGSGSTGYSSYQEGCMVDELGESFAEGYGGELAGELVQSFAAAIETCQLEISVDGLISHLEDSERSYRIADLEAVGFKSSKSYDVRELDSASSAHYGFYGVDPYARLEYEARFYFSHEAARGIGVEFADDSTGAGASLYSDDQRWQEGLTERRRCDSSGGHHVGRCGYPKYFDYVVVGNMVLMCEGKNTLESLEACGDLLDVLE